MTQEPAIDISRYFWSVIFASMVLFSLGVISLCGYEFLYGTAHRGVLVAIIALQSLGVAVAIEALRNEWEG
jgi:hypothetical protein